VVYFNHIRSPLIPAIAMGNAFSGIRMPFRNTPFVLRTGWRDACCYSRAAPPGRAFRAAGKDRAQFVVLMSVNGQSLEFLSALNGSDAALQESGYFLSRIEGLKLDECVRAGLETGEEVFWLGSLESNIRAQTRAPRGRDSNPHYLHFRFSGGAWGAGESGRLPILLAFRRGSNRKKPQGNIV
jgi:hypothetical protein